MHACREQVALPSPPFHSSPSLPVPMSWSSMARICAWADMFVRVEAANVAGVPTHAASPSAGLAVAATLSPREGKARARPQLQHSHDSLEDAKRELVSTKDTKVQRLFRTAAELRCPVVSSDGIKGRRRRRLGPWSHPGKHPTAAASSAATRSTFAPCK